MFATRNRLDVQRTLSFFTFASLSNDNVDQRSDIYGIVMLNSALTDSEMESIAQQLDAQQLSICEEINDAMVAREMMLAMTNAEECSTTWLTVWLVTGQNVLRTLDSMWSADREHIAHWA